MTFHGDLILSKCAREGKIVLWRIQGFSSSAPPPSPEAAPIARLQEPTRSAFGDGYERLLQFQLPKVEPYYIRFNVFAQPFKHAVLAAGNNESTVYFWDLQQLIDWAPNTTLPFSVPTPTTITTAAATTTTRMKGHGQGRGQTKAAAALSTVSNKSADKPGPAHDLSNPFKLVPAHAQKTVAFPKQPRKRFAVRQVAWSVGGEWMVSVGDDSTLAIFGRWDDDEAYIRNGGRT